MKIYLAARFHSRLSLSGSPHVLVSSELDYPYHLESFHYLQHKPRIMKSIADRGKKIFLDSGAFTMFTQGVEVDLSAYADYIKRYDAQIEVASNLDAIGQGNERLSYDRQKELEGMGANIKPVHHVRDHDSWLEQYLSEGYDYIFLGGMVPESTQTLIEWLDHIWHHYLTNEDGTPLIKIHGFGLTTLSLIFRYPWYSVDSTAWVMIASMGGIFMDFPRPDGTTFDCKVQFSEHSPTRHDKNSWHYDQLREPEKKMVLNRLEELEALRPAHPNEKELEKIFGYKQGYNPVALSKSYGWRDHFNIAYFNRAMERRVDRFTREQETLF